MALLSFLILFVTSCSCFFLIIEIMSSPDPKNISLNPIIKTS